MSIDSGSNSDGEGREIVQTIGERDRTEFSLELKYWPDMKWGLGKSHIGVNDE